MSKQLVTFDFTTHILDVRPEGPPHRELLISVRLDNPWDEDVALLSGWTEACLNPPGKVVASGFLLEQNHTRVSPAVVPSLGNLLGDFHVPVSASVIDAVERSRVDQVALQIRARLLIAPVAKEGERSFLGEPREAGLRTIKGEQLGVLVSKSDWIRCNADERLRNGDYAGVLQSCRLALESLAKDASPEGTVADGFQAVLEQSVSGTEMRTRLSELILRLSAVAHLARHENRPHEDIVRADAVFCLRSTLAVVARLTGPTA